MLPSSPAGGLHHYRLCAQSTNDPVVITPDGFDLATINRNHTITSLFIQTDDPKSVSNTNNPLSVFLREGKIAIPNAACTGQESFEVTQCTNTYYSDQISTVASAANGEFFFANDYWNPLVVSQTRWNAWERICQHKDLRVTVRSNTDREVDYCIEHRLHTIPLNLLVDATPFDSETIHPHLCGSRDFFLFNVPASTSAKDSYLWVKLTSVGQASVWVNHGSLADTPCHESYCSTTQLFTRFQVASRDNNNRFVNGGVVLNQFPDDFEHALLEQSCHAHVICNFQTGDYYMTVTAQESYVLEARIVATTTEIVLGSRTDTLTVAPGEYKYFKFTVPQPQKDQYLQVDIADVHSGGL
jgi:hypothetical protein